MAERATVHVSPEVVDDLREYVLRKYGKKWGFMQYEAEQAIRAWIDGEQCERRDA